jgi:hypothetical protein
LRRSNPFFLFAARWIASLALAMTTFELNGCLTIESDEQRRHAAHTPAAAVITRESG